MSSLRKAKLMGHTIKVAEIDLLTIFDFDFRWYYTINKIGIQFCLNKNFSRGFQACTVQIWPLFRTISVPSVPLEVLVLPCENYFQNTSNFWLKLGSWQKFPRIAPLPQAIGNAINFRFFWIINGRWLWKKNQNISKIFNCFKTIY